MHLFILMTLFFPSCLTSFPFFLALSFCFIQEANNWKQLEREHGHHKYERECVRKGHVIFYNDGDD